MATRAPATIGPFGTIISNRDGDGRALYSRGEQLLISGGLLHGEARETGGADQVRELRDQGMGATAIAEKLKISRASVYRVLEA